MRVGFGGFVLDQFGRGPGQPAVRDVDEVQRHAAVGPGPLLPQLVGLDVVDDEVHRPHRGRPQAPRVPQRGQGGQVEAVHEDEDGAAAVVRRRRRLVLTQRVEYLGLGRVLMVEPDQRRDQDHEQDDHHPGALGELHNREDGHHDQRHHAGREVDDQPAPPAGPPVLAVILRHAEAGHGERGEHADGVQRDQAVDVRVLDDDQRHGHDGQHDDRVGEHQPVPALEQPPGQERVAGHVAGQEREPVEAGVAAGVQDQHGRELEQQEHGVPDERAPEDELGLLRQHGGVAGGARRRVGPVGQPGDAGDQDAEDHALGHEHAAGVDALRPPERADGVGDRLDAGQRRAAVGERPEQDEDHGPADQAVRTRAERIGAVQRVRVVRRQVPHQVADQPDDDHQDDRTCEQVGRYREGPAGLLEAAQVPEAHEQHHADGDLDLVRADRGEGGGDRGRARRGLHRHGHHVVDEQRDRAHLGDPRAEVLPRHHVRAARPDVDHDDLAVGQQHQHHDEQDDQRHGQEQGERGQADRGHQHDQDLLGAVGGGGDPVRRQHAERQRVGQPLFPEVLVDQRRPEQPALGGVPEGVGQAAAPFQECCCLARGHYLRLSSVKIPFWGARHFIPSLPASA